MLSNNNNGALDGLPLSSCTDSSVELDDQFLVSNPLKDVDNHPTLLVSERVAAAEELNEEDEGITVEHAGGHQEGEQEEDMDRVEEEEERRQVTEMEQKQDTEAEKKHIAEEEYAEAEDDQTETEAVKVHVNEFTEENQREAEELADNTSTMPICSKPKEETAEAIAAEAVFAPAVVEKGSEPMASGIPQRPVKTGVPTHVQSHSLSAASMALKKKQAAENAAAAIKAAAVEIPETDSIANRIRIFGGAGPGRTIGHRRLGVRDMVQRYRNEEEKRHNEIAHVVRGHNDMEPHGVCNAYSFSTASRPLRSTPRRKMSHELSENETREFAKAFGGMVRNDDDCRTGVSQESVHSVKNAKNIFESLARTESGAQL
ncbi:hypothetical protein BC939DRAFT_455877 [Gamsiella multidivaricata]|uniref:uncharacterized protein n=1 Tax=Gamsiella multidivaricata TaxID=101098 RepID=UPI00221ED4E5|nr:uncharacterized protein BC939DRAFT_455877 [Gamsiella multidivaricata]KAI7821394.1 hypothetical protein BC939DRAFT_455877 [Gamsiella multidivaricata]